MSVVRSGGRRPLSKLILGRAARRAIAVAVVVLLASPAWGEGEDLSRAKWSPVMQEIFSTMVYLLPRSLDEERFSNESERAEIAKQITTLANAVAQLQQSGHEGRDRGSSLVYLSHSLGRDIEEARMRFDAGLYEESRYFVVGALHNCFACHARRPSRNRFQLAEQLTDAVELGDLDPQERAVLFVVTRRFREAIETWQAMLRDPKIDPREVDEAGVLTDYLAVAVRGLQEIVPTRKALEGFSRREGVSPYLKSHLEAWVRALGDIEKHPELLDVKLEQVRALIERADAASDAPRDRHGLVYDLAASSSLHQLIDRGAGTKGALSARDQSEAYLLLGRIEARSMTQFWIDESAHHLEAAVRAMPKSLHAERALSMFEENMIADYGAREVGDLPTDVWVRIQTLRELVHGKPAVAK